MAYPTHRPRRLRRSESLRRMVRETHLAPSQLIYPLFVVEGEKVRQPISSMPGIFNLSIDSAIEEARSAHRLGIGAVLIFGIPDRKDAFGSYGTSENGIVPRAIRAMKTALPALQVLADVCLCEYTDHGHCGVVDQGEVDNDQTLPLLNRMALSCARAGADIIAPSDMMDGRVGAMRKGLDEEGFSHLPILAYSAKYASAFYGPFREAAQSAPQFGDRRSYQMDPANVREALKEVLLDLEEGADLVMVKPALAYLDVIAKVKEQCNLPVVAYNVSGEYSMLQAAAAREWIDGPRAMMEVLTSIRRAGADLIISYHALEAARLLQL